MSAPDLNDLQTQSGGLHALLHMVYEASCDLDYASDNKPAVDAANRVNHLIILARDEAERLDANIGECSVGQIRERKVKASATVAAPLAGGEPIFDPAKLSIEGLFTLHAAIKTVFDVVAGLSCQPRFKNGAGHTPAGEMVDKFCDFLGDVLSDVHDEALSRTPATATEIEQQFFFAANRLVDGSGSPDHVMSELKKEAAKIGGGKAVRTTGGKHHG